MCNKTYFEPQTKLAFKVKVMQSTMTEGKEKSNGKQRERSCSVNVFFVLLK